MVDLRLDALLLVQEGGLVVVGHQDPGELGHAGEGEASLPRMLMLGGLGKDAADDVARSCPAFSLPLGDSSTVWAALNRALYCLVWRPLGLLAKVMTGSFLRWRKIRRPVVLPPWRSSLLRSD